METSTGALFQQHILTYVAYACYIVCAQRVDMAQTGCSIASLFSANFSVSTVRNNCREDIAVTCDRWSPDIRSY